MKGNIFDSFNYSPSNIVWNVNERYFRPLKLHKNRFDCLSKINISACWINRIICKSCSYSGTPQENRNIIKSWSQT
uniref:Candidate secreted effector n=1 Tax=Meloidogyne incognita TaxID=6306 RepID=A0A914MGC2_MELIC